MWQLKPARLVVSKDVLLETTVSLAFASYLFASKKRLRLIFEAIHKAFCLKMGLETHRGSNLLLFLSWPHIPSNPLGLSWLCVDVAVLINGLLKPVLVRTVCSEIHPRWAQHLGGVAHLREALTIVVCLLDRLLGHL